MLFVLNYELFNTGKKSHMSVEHWMCCFRTFNFLLNLFMLKIFVGQLEAKTQQ